MEFSATPRREIRPRNPIPASVADIQCFRASCTSSFGSKLIYLISTASAACVFIQLISKPFGGHRDPCGAEFVASVAIAMATC
jgi:hypothetical protein